MFGKVVMRIGFVGAGSTTVYYCLKYLPVSTVITIMNMAPIFIFFIEAIAYRVLMLIGRNVLVW